jgi:hypothetical protein
VEWARTFRLDAPPAEALNRRIRASLGREGVTVQIAGSPRMNRTYVLTQGSQTVDPAELDGALPDARAYPDAIIALAIEPAPADALPELARALRGPGAPAGIYSCDVAENTLLVEFQPKITPLVLHVVDVELRRFSGTRRTVLIAPLPAQTYARIAAGGLQAPELDTSRILEPLLGIAHVE